jgi:antitoxin YefM
MEQITVNELQNNLHSIFDRITHQHEVISVVRSPNHSVVLLDADDYDSLLETLYLSQPPVNAERLRQGMEQHRQGQVREIDVTAYLD